MFKVGSIGLALGITASLVALGIALGVIVTRVNQSAASTLTLSSSAVLSSADLAVWEDQQKTKPVTSLKFEAILLHPPSGPSVCLRLQYSSRTCPPPTCTS